MYTVIERYRGDARLHPEYIAGTFATIADVKEFIEDYVPKSYAHDWVVIGHGRTVRASTYVTETQT